jgi:hypothetical protein
MIRIFTGRVLAIGRVLQTTCALVLFLGCISFSRATAMDWQLRSSSYLSAEGGWLAGSKVPLNSKTQTEYDAASEKLSPSEASNAIKTLRLQGGEGVFSGNTSLGYEGFSDELNWQANIDATAAAVVGNSTGTFYAPLGDPIFPTFARGGRNSGWNAGINTGLHWIPFSGFSAHLRTAYTLGANSFRENFSRLHLAPAVQLKVARFVVQPVFSWQRILSAEALPAADIRAWSLDVEWLGNKHFRFQNPSGFPLVRSWSSLALGSSLVVQALENEGSFLEFNITPRIIFSPGLSLISHLRSVSGHGQSYISPSRAAAVVALGKKTNDWTPREISAEYSTQTIEWKNTLAYRLQTNMSVSGSILYTSESSAFTPSVLSSTRYSSLIDSARESTFRYFLGAEFLL